jgi:hypothetical protein
MKEKTPQLRTIDKAYDELKARDPNTSLSRYLVRQIIKNDLVPNIKSGNKRLVDVDVLEEYLATLTGCSDMG